MFVIYPSRHLHGTRVTLNAITPINLETDPAQETAEAFRVRQMRTCQEMIELGMTLMREAADNARRDMAAAPPHTPIPCSAAAAIDQAEARARQRQPNYAIVFAQLTRSVRQSLALQAHIFARYPRLCAAWPQDPPERRQAATPVPNRPDPARQQFRAECPDWAIPANLGDQPQLEELIENLRQDLGLPAVQPNATRTLAPADEAAQKPGQHVAAKPNASALTAPKRWRPPIP